MAKKNKLPPRPARSNGGRLQAGSNGAGRTFTSRWLIPLMLAGAAFAVYLQSIHHQFISIDDGAYVFDNPMVADGFTARGIAWAFTAFHSGNWHPLTWLSLMLDCQLFGVNPGWDHLINLLLHAANAVLLYHVLKRMTKAVWRSALAAALFALHPLHVESVAWIAERKDVLSGLFFMLILWAYVRYTEVRSWSRYLAVIAALAGGLMAKAMLVTVPFLLLLLDYWPLARIDLHADRPAGRLRSAVWPLVREKIPLFLMIAVSGVVAYLAQLRGEAVTELSRAPLGSRIAAGIAAYGDYFRLMIWPGRLGILYPHQSPGTPAWERSVWVLLLAAAVVLTIRFVRPRALPVTGWLWFFGMLIPAIGLVQIGAQAFADRYTYLPMIGLFLIFAWALGEMADRRPDWRKPVAVIAIAVIAALAARSFFQVQYWQNSVKLYERTLAVAPENPVILANLGSEYAGQDRLDEAIDCFRRALQFNAGSGRIQASLGRALAQKGRYREAEMHLKEALRLAPDLSSAYHSMGVLLLSQRRLAEAVPYLREAVKLDAGSADAHNAMGTALLMQGKIEEAVGELRAALKINPQLASAQNNLKTALAARSSQSR